MTALPISDDEPQPEPIFVFDIKPRWLDVARRLQAASLTQGYALVSLTILVGPDGLPKAWTEPKCVRIEPKRSTAEILDILGLS